MSLDEPTGSAQQAMGSVPTDEREPSSVHDLSSVLLSSPFYQIHCRGDSSR